jgi:hypothetical protein
MNTPNYFLADLPREALTPTIVAEACIAIKRNRAQFLLKRNTSSLIRTLVTVADTWQDDRDPFRQRALAEAPAEIGFSKEVIARGLDDFFAQITKKNLEQLIIQDLGHVNRLDEMTATDLEHGGERASRAIGAELLVHVAGGALPNPTLLSMILGVLVEMPERRRAHSAVACALDLRDRSEAWRLHGTGRLDGRPCRTRRCGVFARHLRHRDRIGRDLSRCAEAARRKRQIYRLWPSCQLRLRHGGNAFRFYPAENRQQSR